MFNQTLSFDPLRLPETKFSFVILFVVFLSNCRKQSLENKLNEPTALTSSVSVKRIFLTAGKVVRTDTEFTVVGFIKSRV